MEDDNRGAAIKQRREALGLGVQELAELAGVRRESVTRAEKGVSTSDVMYSKLENALAARDDEMSGPPGGDIIELVVEGVYGARVIRMRGPVADLPEMERSIARLIKRFEGDSE